MVMVVLSVTSCSVVNKVQVLSAVAVVVVVVVQQF
jgi:hypothetical protein